MAKDSAGNDIEQPSEIEIQVKDLNDNQPVFTQESYEASVKENSKEGKIGNICI